jgi:kynureninase
MSDAIARARELDAADPLQHFRDAFVIDDPELIYLDGNSLGRMPKKAAERIKTLVDKEWGARLIRAWGDTWFDMPQRLGAKLAPLIGAQPGEVILCDNTTTNLYKLVNAILEISIGRTEIATDHDNFPSDLYVLQGIAKNAGLKIIPPHAIGPKTALLTLSHVSFKQGEINDMASLTELAHAQGAYALWDLSHSVGAIPVDLNRSNVDLAVGCTYKYLNGGPGSTAFLYVRRDLQEKLANPIQGWFGRDNAFDFGLDYQPREGILRFLTGSPNILSMAATEAGIDLVAEAGIGNLRRKSLAQTGFLIELWREHLEPLGVSLNTPEEHHRRGSHVSLGHPDALAIDQALIEEHQVIPDFRTPDNIRFGVTPLYTTYEEIALAMLRMRQIVASKSYTKYAGKAPAVT